MRALDILSVLVATFKVALFSFLRHCQTEPESIDFFLYIDCILNVDPTSLFSKQTFCGITDHKPFQTSVCVYK